MQTPLLNKEVVLRGIYFEARKVVGSTKYMKQSVNDDLFLLIKNINMSFLKLRSAPLKPV